MPTWPAAVTGASIGIGAAVARALRHQGARGVHNASRTIGSYLYLAADSLSGYVTGQIPEVNGGQLIA